VADLNVSLTSCLTVQPAQDCSPGSGPGTTVLNMALQSTTQSAQTAVGQQSYSVASVTNESLPFPTSFAARLFVMRVLSGTLAVRVTYATAGQVTLQTNGMLVLEVPEAERITAVDVTGSAEFDWHATGQNSA
jgi:hypothetical protein